MTIISTVETTEPELNLNSGYNTYTLQSCSQFDESTFKLEAELLCCLKSPEM